MIGPVDTFENKESRIAKVRAILEAERNTGSLSLNHLKVEITEATAALEQISFAVSKEKEQAKKRKSEIDEWKVWYQGLDEEMKEVGLAKLQNEIKWRAAELETLTTKISQLMSEQAKALGNCKLAEQRIAAYMAGVFDRPIDEDPRFIELTAQYDSVEG